jgi:hypothetical protein
MKLTKDIAQNLRVGTLLYSRAYTRGGGKMPLRVRVNGRCKVWKTRPTQFRLPVKWGMYEYGYITDQEVSLWDTEQDAAWSAIEEARRYVGLDERGMK